MASVFTPKTVFMVAGEASGDLHGSHVVRSLRQHLPSVRVCGMGGSAMQGEGARIFINSNQLSVVGITEVLLKIPQLYKAMARLKKLLVQMRPDLLILIDFPDFNLHLAAFAKQLRIPVLYYISPQIWAWRPKRVHKIKARVDHMAVILPFEQGFYQQQGVPVTFVGHPLMDIEENAGVFDSRLPTSPAEIVVGLLPGSREREVTRLLPVMLEAGSVLQRKLPNIRFLISCAPSIQPNQIDQILTHYPLPQADIVTLPIRSVFSHCHLVIAASGTVTLEAAIYGIPMVITYTVSLLSYLMGKALIKVDHIGLVNLIAQQRIVPELIQQQVTPENIAEEAQAILSDPAAYTAMCQALHEVRRRMGKSGASQKVVQIATALMEAGHAVR